MLIYLNDERSSGLQGGETSFYTGSYGDIDVEKTRVLAYKPKVRNFASLRFASVRFGLTLPVCFCSSVRFPHVFISGAPPCCTGMGIGVCFTKGGRCGREPSTY